MRAGDDEGENLIGTAVAGFRLERRLGAGATGEVWLGRHEVSGGLGAAKILSSSAKKKEHVRDFFSNEWKVVQRLGHPNIVRVFASGDGFLVTAFVEGTNLARRLRSPMSPQDGVAVCLQIASALAHAHEQGVIHRDVKPGNILLDREGNAFLADFGLAKVDDEGDRTLVVGTAGYMAPEQAFGAHVGQEADQYALARILVEILVGNQLPLEPAEALALLPSVIPEGLRDILKRATSRSPALRYSSMRALIHDLRQVELGDVYIAERLAPLRRSPTDFQWLSGGQETTDPQEETWEARYSLSGLVAAGLLGSSGMKPMASRYGLADMGWSVFGRRSRVGPALDPNCLARAADIVVLMHGGNADRGMWTDLARALCQSDAQTIVLTPDVAGYGASPRIPDPSPEQATPRALGLSVLELLSMLGLETAPTVLVGHSMAGVAMLSLRDDELGPLRTRIAVSPVFPQYHLSMRLQLRASVWAMRAVRNYPRIRNALAKFALHTTAVTRNLSKESKAWYYQIHLETCPDALITSFEGLVGAECAPGEQLQRSLIVSGLDDPLAPPKIVDKALAILKIPDVRSQKMAKGGHLPLLELQDGAGFTSQNHHAVLHAIESMMLEVESGSGSLRAVRHSLAFGSTVHGDQPVVDGYEETAMGEDLS